MKRRVIPSAGKFGIGTWAQPRPKCLGCGNALSARDEVNPGVDPEVCRHCDDEAIRIRIDEQCGEKKRKHDEAWKTCYDCQGGAFQNVTCANRTCSNFFHRDRTTLDMEDMFRDQRRITPIQPGRLQAQTLMRISRLQRRSPISGDVIRYIARLIKQGVRERSERKRAEKRARKE